jgi:hypothetical protein
VLGDEDSRPFVELTSTISVLVPIVPLLICIDWAKGRDNCPSI